ncbi:MAG: type II toxin-antitoxin system Phd/YefM family antitoxin [bacterium]
MKQIAVNQDIIPLTEFRNKLTDKIAGAQKTGCPLVVTQNGRGAVVILSVEVYQQLIDELEFHKGNVLGMHEALHGETDDFDTVMDEVIAELPYED